MFSRMATVAFCIFFFFFLPLWFLFLAATRNRHETQEEQSLKNHAGLDKNLLKPSRRTSQTNEKFIDYLIKCTHFSWPQHASQLLKVSCILLIHYSIPKTTPTAQFFFLNSLSYFKSFGSRKSSFIFPVLSKQEKESRRIKRYFWNVYPT